MSQVAQLAEAKKRTKRKLKKEKPNDRIWLVGSRKWTDKKAIKTVLKQYDYKTVDFILLGTSPGLEQLALTVCRKMKFNVILLPPNVTRDGINATYFRNYTGFMLFKPTAVYAFHDDMEHSKSSSQLVKLARAKKIEFGVITTKVKK